MASGNTDLIQSHPPVILVLVSEFGTNFTSLNSRQVLVGVPVSYLNNEWLNAIVIHVSLTIWNQALGHDNCKVCSTTQLSGPPLGRIYRWCMQHELISLLIEDGSGFQ